MKIAKLIAMMLVLLIINFPLINALVISNVNNIPSTNTATITWNTDAEANSVVMYGTETTDLSESRNVQLLTEHSVQLTNLQQGTTYSYYVVSNDGTNPARMPESGFNEFTTLQDVNVLQIDQLPSILATNRVAITGRTEPNAVITFFKGNLQFRILESGQEIIQGGYAIQTDASGNIDATILLDSGSNDITIISRKATHIDTKTITITVDIDPPELYVAEISTPRKDATFTLRGTTEPGAIVKYSIYKIINDTLEAIEINKSIDVVNGSFNINITIAGSQIEGKFKLMVSSTDAVGNKREYSQIIEIDNKPPELVSINLPTGTVHFNIISIDGEVSEPFATVIIKNTGAQSITDIDSASDIGEIQDVSEYIETTASLTFDPFGEIVRYSKEFNADENGYFSGMLALVTGDNNLIIQVRDRAGNVYMGTQPHTVSLATGSSTWKVGRITTIPNDVYTDLLRAGDVDVSLIFYLYYFGPTLGKVTVGRDAVHVMKEGGNSKKDNKFIEVVSTNSYYDEDKQEIFVYSRLKVKQFGGDVYTLPDQLNFAFETKVTYSYEGYSPGEVYGMAPDLTPVYFETAVAVEKPLKYTKWLTPRMINSTIRTLDSMIDPLQKIVDFTGKLGVVTMGLCAVYTFASYFMEPDYKTLYTICDRVQCPYVPPACEEFGKSFNWEKDGNVISDDDWKKFNAPTQADASTKPYYKNKQTGEILFEIPAGQESNYEQVSTGNYYILTKPEKTDDEKIITRDYAMSQEDYENYIAEFDVFNKNKEGKWVAASGQTLSQQDYEKQQKDVKIDETWKPSDAFYTGATKYGRYTIEYFSRDQLRQTRILGEMPVCPSNLPNAVITYSAGQGTLMGAENIPTGTGPYWGNNVEVKDIGYGIQCTSMTRTMFDANSPSFEGISRCFTPGAPSYDETRCLDQSVKDENPFEDIILSTRCGCITGIRGNLDNYLKVLNAMKQCMQQAYIGQVRGGYCERLMAQFVCDFAVFAIEKSTRTREKSVMVGGDSRNPISIKNNVQDVNAHLDARYQGAFTSQFGLDSRQLVHKMCIGAISADWSTFKDVVNTMARAPVEPVVGPLMPESRITAYDPFTGRLTINYLFTLGIMSGGQDVEYEVRLTCDPDKPGGESCPRDRPATPLIYNGYVPRDGSISENVPYVEQNAIYWYNRADFTLKYKLGTEIKMKQLTETIVHKGSLIAQCHIQAMPAMIICETITPEGAGKVEMKNVMLSPPISLYYPDNKVAVKMNLRKIGAPPDMVYIYWELKKPQTGQAAGVQPDIITSNTPGLGINPNDLIINTAGLGQDFSVRNQYLFTFERGAEAGAEVMSGIGNVNIPLTVGNKLTVSAKIESQALDQQPIEKQISGISVTAKKNDGTSKTLSCSPNPQNNLEQICETSEDVTITRIEVQVKSDKQVNIFVNEQALFTASTPSGARFPEGSYELTIKLYKDKNNDQIIDTQVDEPILAEGGGAMSQTLNFQYGLQTDCVNPPVIDIIYPFEISNTMLYMCDDGYVEANIIDDCNEIKDVKLKIVKEGNEQITDIISEEVVGKEKLTYRFTNLKDKLSQYRDGNSLSLEVSATAGDKTGISPRVDVTRKVGNCLSSSSGTEGQGE